MAAERTEKTNYMWPALSVMCLPVIYQCLVCASATCRSERDVSPYVKTKMNKWNLCTTAEKQEEQRNQRENEEKKWEKRYRHCYSTWLSPRGSNCMNIQQNQHSYRKRMYECFLVIDSKGILMLVSNNDFALHDCIRDCNLHKMFIQFGNRWMRCWHHFSTICVRVLSAHVNHMSNVTTHHYTAIDTIDAARIC